MISNKMVKARKYVSKSFFKGFPKKSDVEIVEEELPPLKNGEFLAEAVYISVDPYMRIVEQQIGNVMIGTQVAKIIESKSKDYPVGKYIVGNFGWRTHTIAKQLSISVFERIISDFEDLPISLALGVLGMPGNTAYFGFLEVCKPQKGETVVVSGAGGAVGSHVGQIAKIMGCHVIGILGDDQKGKYITEELGFDYYINYKTPNIKENLKKYAPNGIDCFFDNVGGELSSTVINQMNPSGRIAVCGHISEYNDEASIKISAIHKVFVFKQLRMEGVRIYNWTSIERWNEGIEQNLKWIKESKLKYKETITEGFDNVFEAFIGLFEGKNIGKAIVKI